MSALPPVSKVIRADFLQTVGANTSVLNRIFFQYSGTLSLADLTTLLTTFSNAWGTNISPNQNTGATLTAVRGTDLSSSTAPQTIISTSKVGTAAGSGMPDGTAAVIKFKINRRYRGGHPRFYETALVVTNVQNGTQIVPASATAFANSFAAFIAACVLAPPAAVGTLTHVNVHYFSGFTNKTFPSGRTRAVPNLLATPTVDSILSYSTNAHVGSQRRRNQQSP
jgi:hypothetical protein